MTIKEFIEELSKLNQDMIVVIGDSEDYPSEPYLNIKKYEFKILYWGDNLELKAIPECTEFLEL